MRLKGYVQSVGYAELRWFRRRGAFRRRCWQARRRAPNSAGCPGRLRRVHKWINIENVPDDMRHLWETISGALAER